MAKGATLSEIGPTAGAGPAAGDAQRRLQQAQGHRLRLLKIAQGVLSPGEPEEALDVVQEVMTRLATAAPPASLPAWLTAVTYRCALDLKRRRARRATPGEIGDPVSKELGPRDTAARAELARAALGALESLDEPYRRALQLRFCEGRSFPEIAAEMKSLERTTRTWVGRGLTRLRAAMLAGGAL